MAMQGDIQVNCTNFFIHTSINLYKLLQGTFPWDEKETLNCPRAAPFEDFCLSIMSPDITVVNEGWLQNPQFGIKYEGMHSQSSIY